jgi:hypothetical protein
VPRGDHAPHDQRRALLNGSKLPKGVGMNKATPRTFHVKNFGCQMNVYDGERMAEMLGAEGMAAAADAASADLVVLNTCTSAKRPPRKSIRISVGSSAMMVRARP